MDHGVDDPTMTENEVRAAKVAFQFELTFNGTPPWLRGVGIGKDALGYFIKVNTEAALPEGTVASSFNGARILTEVVGDIRAFKP
jgi:hypothetical protein